MRLVKNADRLQRTEIKRINRDTVTAMAHGVKAEVVPRTPIGHTASLAGSIEVGGPFHKGQKYIAEVSSSGVVYAEPVEWGRRPGRMPPYRDLIPWVRFKMRQGAFSGPAATGRKRLSAKSEKAARSIAYLIARRIGKVGTKGAHMFSMGLKAAKGKLSAITRSRVRAIERLFVEGLR